MSTEKDLSRLLDQLTAGNAILSIIATDLGRIAQALAPAGPNYRHQLAAYHNFDWSTIGATVEAADRDGVSAVHWSGYTWTRRSDDSKFGRAIWYSRANGKDSEGKTQYLKLITFADIAPAEALAFQPGKSGSKTPTPNPQPQTPADPAAAQHLTYGDGNPVPGNPDTIQVFNAFMYAHRRAPKDAAELKAWHEQQQEGTT